MSPRNLTVDQVLRAIGRRRWMLLVPFAIGLALAPVLATLAPERYRSEALIMVVPGQPQAGPYGQAPQQQYPPQQPPYPPQY